MKRIILLICFSVTVFFGYSEDNSLCEASRNVLDTLSGNITVYAFFSKNLPEPYNSVKDQARDILAKYQSYSPEHFTIIFYDMDESYHVSKASECLINSVCMQTIENDNISIRDVYMGLSFIYDDLIETIQPVPNSSQLEYKITTTIRNINNLKNALDNLDDAIEIKYFYSPLLGDITIKMIEELSVIIENINIQFNNYLGFSYFDTSANEHAEAEAKEYGVYCVPEQYSYSDKKLYFGIIISSNGEYKEIPLVYNDIFGGVSLLELAYIAENIKQAVEDIISLKNDIGYVSDNSTMPLNELSDFTHSLEDNYKIREIDLESAEQADLPDTIIIAGPKEPFSEKQLFILDQHLMSGKSIALFIDTHEIINTEDNPEYNGTEAPFIYRPLNLGIDKLLEHYGIVIEKSYVLDQNCYHEPYVQGGKNIYYSPIIPPDCQNQDSVITNNLNSIYLLNVSPLHYDPGEQNHVKAELLLNTTETSWKMSGSINLHNPLSINLPDADEQKEQKLSYLLEGSFSSYFDSSRTILTDNEFQFIEQNSGGKLFILGTTTILSDLFYKDENISNTDFVLNVIDYLNNNTELIELRNR